MLTLMLMVALMTIAAAACLPTITFEIRRDREEEMIHRGVQYTRAIRAYYKKFGRYPTKLEDLDSTNKMRFLRKHYKDPITGQDFKLLHYGDPGITLAGGLGGMGGAGIAGATSVANMNGNNSGSSLGSGSSGGAFGGNGNSAFGGSGGGFGQSSGFGGNSSFGGNSNSGFGSSSNNTPNTDSSGTIAPGGTSSTQADGSAPGSSNAVEGSSDQNGANGPNESNGLNGSSSASNSGSNASGQFGGGAIIGVASASKKDTIREFNKKHKYNQWQFIYDPTMDRGALIYTPYQPQLQAMGSQNLNGQPGQSGSSNNGSSPFGQSNGSSSFGQSNGSSFGQSSGFGNNNSSFGGGSNPTQPPATPPEQ